MNRLNIVYKSVNDLKMYAKNARKNEKAVPVVAKSIRDFGFKNPIIIDGKGEIIAGHTRYLAAKQLGLSEVPCVVASDLTPEQVKAFRLVDNKTSEFAEWDYDLLNSELMDLKELNKIIHSIDLDMSEYGFYSSSEDEDVFDHMFDFSSPQPKNDPPQRPSEPERPQAWPGQNEQQGYQPSQAWSEPQGYPGNSQSQHNEDENKIYRIIVVTTNEEDATELFDRLMEEGYMVSKG